MSESSAESAERNGSVTEVGARPDVLDVLADEKRRDAIEYLALADEAVSLDDLVDFVAATVVSGSRPQTRKQTAVRFHHVHLPKMDAAELIDYDSDNHLVTPTEKTTDAMQILTQRRENRIQ